MTHSHKTLLLAVAATLLLAACSKQNVDPSTDAYAKNDADIKAYVAQKGWNGLQQASGLYYLNTAANPTGKPATIGEEVEFTYKSYKFGASGDTLIDSSVAGRPVYYVLGINSILAGLEQGLSLMREGESATLLIPSYLGYGDRALTNLKPYSPVRFDVKLIRSRSEEQQIREYIAAQKLAPVDSSITGLRMIKTQSNPTGVKPNPGQTIAVRYAGRTLRSATAFDSTGTSSVDMTPGLNKYIKGFEEGLAQLRVGEKAILIFPSSLGYGTKGALNGNTYVITPNTPLRFDVEVVAAK